MSYYLANGFLFFTDGLLIMPLVILGFIWVSRFTFYHAIALMLFSMIINVALKITFQIPLSPSLHKVGFAFPSGHMQLASVFYLFLAHQFKRNWFSLLTVVLLISIGYGLIYFGYHNIYDVTAAFFTAGLILFVYWFSTKTLPQLTPWLILAIASLLLYYIHQQYPPIAHFIWAAYFTLWGLVLAEKMAAKRGNTLIISEKILASILCLSLLVIVQFGFLYLVDTKPMPAPLAELQWLIIGFIIPSFDFYTKALLKRKNKS